MVSWPAWGFGRVAAWPGRRPGRSAGCRRPRARSLAPVTGTVAAGPFHQPSGAAVCWATCLQALSASVLARRLPGAPLAKTAVHGSIAGCTIIDDVQLKHSTRAIPRGRNFASAILSQRWDKEESRGVRSKLGTVERLSSTLHIGLRCAAQGLASTLRRQRGIARAYTSSPAQLCGGGGRKVQAATVATCRAG